MKNFKVCLIEKHPSLAWLYREELSEAGFMVDVHHDLLSAKRAIRAHGAHVLVTDLGTVGEQPQLWLSGLRQDYRGPVVVLVHPRQDKSACQGMTTVPKTSNIAPLINSLRGHAMQVYWAEAAGSC